MNTFLTSNEAKYRLARTIVQGLIGVLIANIDLLMGYVVIDISLRPLVVAVVMAILSPIMAALGESSTYKATAGEGVYDDGRGADE